MSEVNITVVGNVATEPKMDRNKNGDAFAHFRLACNNARYDSRTRTWLDDDTSFYTVYCWRSPLADNIAASLRKGDPVVVYGRLKNREWRDKNDVVRVSPEITARSLGHDLYRGTSTFTKVSRQPVIPDEDDAVETVREMYANDADDLGRAGAGSDPFAGIGNGMPGGNGLRTELGPAYADTGQSSAGAGQSRDGGARGDGARGDGGGGGGTHGDDESRGADTPAGSLADVTTITRPASRSRRDKAGAPA